MNETLKILIVSDVDLLSAGKISEKYVCHSDSIAPSQVYDACIICGPFTHEPILTKEDEAIAIGVMASIIAQFENIVCRVIYLPHDNDPIPTLVSQLSLTPNSINIYARSLPLLNYLYVAGYAEKDNVLSPNSFHENGQEDECDSDDENHDELMRNNYEIQTSTSSKIIEEILTNAPAYAYPNCTKSPSSPSTSSSTSAATTPYGIFILNYKYLHTLNHFLFFQFDLLQSVKIKLAIIPTPSAAADSSSSSSSSATSQEQKKNEIVLPKQLRGLTIISPPSLRLTGGYSVVTLSRISNSWEVLEALDCKIIN